MSLVFERITPVRALAITCIDTWGNKIIVGTKNEGVLMLQIASQKDMLCAYADDYVLNASPVRQLNVIDDYLVALTGGKCTMCDLNMSDKTKWKCDIPLSHIEEYSLCSDREGFMICVRSMGKFCFYKLEFGASVIGKKCEFNLIASIYFPFLTSQMVLTESRLYVTYKQASGEDTCGCFKITDNDKCEDLFTHDNFITAMQYFGTDTVLIHPEGMESVICKQNAQKKWQKTNQLFRGNKPTAIAFMETYFIGISDKTVELISSDPSRKERLLGHIESYGPLKYITQKSTIYVANSYEIWRITPPFLIRPFRSSSIILDTPSTPYKFSPYYSLAVLGESEENVRYLAHQGITSIEKLAEIPEYTIKANYSKYYQVYLRAVEVMKQQQKNKEENQPVSSPVIPGVIKPQDLLDVLLMPREYINFLGSQLIFTVGQFASMSRRDVKSLSEALCDCHEKAINAVQGSTAPKTVAWQNQVYGYVYCTKSELPSIMKSKTLKSPYVLFQEFMELEEEERNAHPWKNVFFQHFKATSGVNPNTKVSDSEVFSYLCWRHATDDIGKCDNTAGARAFYFHVSEQVGPKPEDILRINLTELCAKEGGKLYNLQNVWTKVSPEEFESNKSQLLPRSRVGNPLGCIVMPSGTISFDYVSY